MRVLLALILTLISSHTLAQSNEFFVVYIATNTSATPGASADLLVFDLNGKLYLGDNAVDQGGSIMPTTYENEERNIREIFLRNCLQPAASLPQPIVNLRQQFSEISSYSEMVQFHQLFSTADSAEQCFSTGGKPHSFYSSSTRVLTLRNLSIDEGPVTFQEVVVQLPTDLDVLSSQPANP